MVASKIMVAYDGSEYSCKALEWALALQERKGATVEVITVLPPVSSFYVYQTPSPNIPSAFDLHKKQKDSLTEEMAQLVKDCAARGRTITAELLEGDVTETLLAHSTACGADLIVTGTRGRGGFTGLFLGSIAQRLVTYAKIPVVVVK